MGVRLKGSGNGARWYGLTSQGVFLGALAIGYLSPPDEQSVRDQVLAPAVPFFMGALVVMMIRTALVGTYFGADQIRVRSWWWTHTMPVASGLRFDSEPWAGWVTSWIDSRTYSQHSARWERNGFRRRRSFPVLVARPRRALELAAVTNQFADAWRAAPSAELARDYARGASWTRIVSDIRSQHARPIPTVLEHLGLVELPESPPEKKRNSRHADKADGER